MEYCSNTLDKIIKEDLWESLELTKNDVII